MVLCRPVAVQSHRRLKQDLTIGTLPTHIHGPEFSEIGKGGCCFRICLDRYSVVVDGPPMCAYFCFVEQERTRPLYQQKRFLDCIRYPEHLDRCGRVRHSDPANPKTATAIGPTLPSLLSFPARWTVSYRFPYSSLGLQLTSLSVTVASILRTTAVSNSLENQQDITYSFITRGVWTLIEANLGIICACLTVLGRPFTRFVLWPFRKARELISGRHDVSEENCVRRCESGIHLKTMKDSKNLADDRNGSEEQIIKPVLEFSSGDGDAAESAESERRSLGSCSENVLRQKGGF